jgi:hypothetical protein
MQARVFSMEATPAATEDVGFSPPWYASFVSCHPDLQHLNLTPREPERVLACTQESFKEFFDSMKLLYEQHRYVFCHFLSFAFCITCMLMLVFFWQVSSMFNI